MNSDLATAPANGCSAHGNHFVQFYEDDGYLSASVAKFFAEGLEDNAGAIIIATPSHRSAVEHRLVEQGFQLNGHNGSGRYVALDAAGTLNAFMVDGMPNRARFQEVVGGLVRSMGKHHPGLRAFGEMVALLWAEGNGRAAIELEELWNDLGKTEHFQLFCAYPMNGFRHSSNGHEFEDICRAHTAVLPSETYLAQPDADRLRQIAVLQQKAAALEAEIARRCEMEEKLRRQVEDLQRLHECSVRFTGEKDLGKIFNEVLLAALDVHQTDRGLLSMFEPGLEVLKIVASAGFSSDFLERVENVPLGAGACGTCFKDKKRIIVEDTETDPLFGPYREAARLAAFRAVHSTPLVTRSGKAIGVLSVHFPARRTPDEREIRLMDLYARQVADIIEGARLREESEREIAERKKAQESIARLAAIVEHSDDAIISKDLNGVIKTWNRGAERLFGYTGAEAIGQSVSLVIPDGRDDEERNILSRLSRGEAIENYETGRRRKDGTIVDISLTVSPIRNDQGQVIGASSVARDISERIRAREKLEQTVAERTVQLRDTVAELEAFSYSVAHDMRAPLRAMNSYSRYLEQDFAHLLPPAAQNFLQRISAGAGRLDSLITDVLNYSRIARGDMPLETVDVENLTREILDSYAHLHDSGATILVQSPIPAVLANRAALTQCVSNLLSNAIKFVVPGTSPKVIIRAEKREEFVRLYVEDNGIGISEEGKQRIFKMFQRLNPAGEFQGTGIGLTIVRKAVERMGGRVGVESQPGVGSQFWLELKRGA